MIITFHRRELNEQVENIFEFKIRRLQLLLILVNLIRVLNFRGCILTLIHIKRRADYIRHLRCQFPVIFI